MTTKHINCHCNSGLPQTMQRWSHNARWQIKQLNTMLEDFGDEQKFEEYIDFGIHFGVGTETMKIDFNPATWEQFEDTAMFFICHLIETSDGLSDYPFYAEMFENYSKKLGLHAGCFSDGM